MLRILPPKKVLEPWLFILDSSLACVNETDSFSRVNLIIKIFRQKLMSQNTYNFNPIQYNYKTKIKISWMCQSAANCCILYVNFTVKYVF